jgi:Zn-dependent peptidase ImmA (M78 family)
MPNFERHVLNSVRHAKAKSEFAVSRAQYYAAMRQLAHSTRAKHSVTTEALNLISIAKIFKSEGIQLDRRELKSRRIRAAYFCDSDGCSVLVNKRLPREPKIFALIHEFKHHLVDREAICDGTLECGDYNAHELIEKGAEVFAAEFIYPESEMLNLLNQLGIKAPATMEDVCRLKHECSAPVSFTFICKRLEWLRLSPPGAFAGVQFQKEYYTLYGLPIYKQQWFKDRRAQRRPKRL